MSGNIRFRDVWSTIRIELRMNKGFRIRSVIALYRLSTYAHRGASHARVLLWPVKIFYKAYTEFLLGIELPASVQIECGLRLYHGVGLVVHPNARIGSGCLLRQGVTIGNKGEGSQSLPIIGNSVEFGAGSTLIGPVIVGDGAVIGAGTVVTKDVPPGCIVVSAPPRFIEK